MEPASSRQFEADRCGVQTPVCLVAHSRYVPIESRTGETGISRSHFPLFLLKQKGQSLVEVALFLPIFVILLAGLVEVSQIVIAQNRISNAARTGTRFAANGGEDAGIVQVTLDGITQTLDAEEGVWDIWTIRARVNDAGDGFETWAFTHAYGISNTVRFPDVDESAVQAEVLAELQSDQNGDKVANPAGLLIVGTYMIHDLDSILGLNGLPWLAGVNSVKGVSVMRLVGFDNEETDGCDAFPVAVSEDLRSATAPGVGPYPFPDTADFDPNSPVQEYVDFYNHVPNVPLADAKEGYVFVINNGFAKGDFGWLRWNTGQPSSAETLAASLTWPGNSKDYRQVDTGLALPGIGKILGYVEPNDVTDTSMQIGDLVADVHGHMNFEPIRERLTDHINKKRVLRMIVWDQATDHEGYGEYRISGFAMFRFLGYNLSEGWILAEFIGWDESCGQI